MQKNKTRAEEIDYADLYGTRVLVFLEKEPQSNKYYQILLTPEMYKNMTATIARPTGKKDGDIEEYSIKTSEEEYSLPDVREAYSDN